jgi:hypothetical protein
MPFMGDIECSTECSDMIIGHDVEQAPILFSSKVEEE